MLEQEQHWIAKLKQSDKKAYEVIFKAYYKPIYGTALRMTRDAEVANDACQEVFLELWKNRERLEVRSLKSYLHRSVVNRSLNILKSRKRHSGSADAEVELARKVIDGNPAQAAEQQELEAIIQKGIDGLPNRCREVFVLSRFEGKSYKEIGKALNISVKTVENQMSKALKTLREIVQQYKADE